MSAKLDQKALERAVRRAMENAGTLPAKEAVKLVPADWHRICDLVLDPNKTEALRPGSTGEDEGWRDISTAPKDGSEALVTGFIWNDESKGRWQQVAAWNGDAWATEQAPLHPPTHWMPLPSPPGVGA